MFSDVVLLHGNSLNLLPGTPTNNAPASPATSSGNTPPVSSANTGPTGERNICSSEKMTQTGDGNVWSTCQANNPQTDLGKSEAMTCQELLALGGALGAALPTGQLARDSFLNSLAKGNCNVYFNNEIITNNHGLCAGITDRGNAGSQQQQQQQQQERAAEWTNEATGQGVQINCPCCCEIAGGTSASQWTEAPDGSNSKWRRSQTRKLLKATGSCCVCVVYCVQRWVKKLVEHKYFQQGILLAILINTLSMGIEYHNQVDTIVSLFIICPLNRLLVQPCLLKSH